MRNCIFLILCIIPFAASAQSDRDEMKRAFYSSFPTATVDTLDDYYVAMLEKHQVFSHQQSNGRELDPMMESMMMGPMQRMHGRSGPDLTPELWLNNDPGQGEVGRLALFAEPSGQGAYDFRSMKIEYSVLQHLDAGTLVMVQTKVKFRDERKSPIVDSHGPYLFNGDGLKNQPTGGNAWSDGIWLVKGTHSYSTVDGGSRTVLVVTTAPDDLPKPPEYPELVLEEVRVWTSSSGDHKTKAAISNYEKGVAKLRKTNGDLVEVPLSRLSAEDRSWIQEWIKEKKGTSRSRRGRRRR